AIANLRVPIYKIRPTLKQSWKYIRYGILPMITLILMEVNYKVDVIMLERMGIVKAEIGVYSLGVMLAQKLWMIPDALKDILTSKLAAGKKEEEVSKITRISLWVTLLCVIAMFILGKPLIRIVFGAEYNGAYNVFVNISLGVLGMVFYKMIYAYNVVNGHKNINFVLLAIAAAANVVLNYFLIQSMGINGAAIASTVSYCICGFSFLCYFVKKTDQPLSKLLLVTKSDFKELKGFIRK
ncbi:MAG: polysaccharide biosynthesis C-terminal domain-containing protein, partial [Clostridia bacterium]|nr:polysaccharide biosynthesis C-terminal domain-containing protein [Clostridia bacterium]